MQLLSVVEQQSETTVPEFDRILDFQSEKQLTLPILPIYFDIFLLQLLWVVVQQ